MTGELNAPRTPLIKAETRWLKSPYVGVVFERHNTRSRETHRASQREKSVEQAGSLNSFARVANPPTVCPQSHACDVCLEERTLHEFASTSAHSTTCWAEYPRPLQRAQHLSLCGLRERFQQLHSGKRHAAPAIEHRSFNIICLPVSSEY